MTLSRAAIDKPQALAKEFFRIPLYLYQLGWGPALGWIPLLVLTSKGRASGEARHVVVEYRRHGNKCYVVSGWGKHTDWYKNVMENPRVTLQIGGDVLDAKTEAVDNPAEVLSVLYMFSRNSWIYETMFAQMSSAPAGNLNSLADVVDEFTVVRLEPTGDDPELPTVERFSEPVRQMATICAVIAGVWVLSSLLRALLPGGGRERRTRDR